MSKKIILMGLAYFAGVAAAVAYNKKNPEQISKELSQVPQNSQDKLQVFWNNFVEIHKTFLENLKTKHLNDEQKALFSEKEQEVLEKFEEYKSKAKSIFQEYSQKGEEYSKEGSEKIDEVYQEVKSEITELKAKAPEKIDELQTKLNSFLDDLKKRLKK